MPATYLVGPRGPEYRRQGEDVRWYAYDGLGSVLAEVTPAGVMTASRTYDVYGLARSSNGTSTSKHKFVGSLGHTSEDDTGLVYMRARWVDPAVGRFVSEDPARDGGNWFGYCAANPVNAVDADGKTVDWGCAVAGFLLACVAIACAFFSPVLPVLIVPAVLAGGGAAMYFARAFGATSSEMKALSLAFGSGLGGTASPFVNPIYEDLIKTTVLGGGALCRLGGAGARVATVVTCATLGAIAALALVEVID